MSCIYRWWKTKTDVLLDAFLDDAAQELTPPDLGDLRRDLHGYLRQLADFLGRADAGAVYRALLGHAQHEPSFAEVLRARYHDEQRRRDHLPLQRAIERGEVAADVDVDAEMDQLVGPIYYRVLVTGDPVGPAFVDRLVDGLLGRLDG